MHNIAKLYRKDNRTLRCWFRKLGVRTSDRIEATRLAKTTIQRISFNGTVEDKAHLVGLSTGDLSVRREGFLVGLGLDTARRGMVHLFKGLSGNHSRIWESSRLDKITREFVKRLYLSR